MKELEIVAKNVETAIQQGLLQLGLEREDVTIRIKDAGGMFKKAKVVLEYEDKTAPVVEETVEEVKPVVEEKTAEPVAPKKVEKQEKVKKEKTYSTERNQLLEDFLKYIQANLDVSIHSILQHILLQVHQLHQYVIQLGYLHVAFRL